MEVKEEFLKYIYHEDLYLVDESDIPEPAAAIQPKPEQESEEVQVQEPLPITFFGNNERGILFIVQDASDELLNQKDLDFLMKIVESGLKYSRNDFALVNIAKQSLQQTIEEVAHNSLIIFGVDTSDLFTDQTLYSILEIGEKRILLSESLDILAGDDAKKRKLWSALKTMFNI